MVKKVGKQGQGDGNFTKLPDGRVRWRTTVTTQAGQRIAASGTAENKTAAKNAVKAVRDANEKNQLTRKKDNISVEQLVRDYIDAQIRKEKIKSRTVDDYSYTLERYIVPHIGALKAQKVTPDDLKRFFDTQLEMPYVLKGNSPGRTGKRTKGKIHSLLQASYRWGMQNNIVLNDPTALGRPDPGKKVAKETRPKLLTPHEARRFYGVASQHEWGWVYAIMLALGLRPGEALGLRKDDLQLRNDGKVLLSIQRTRSVSQGKIYEDTPKTKDSARKLIVMGHPAFILRQCLVRIEEDRAHPVAYKGQPYQVTDYLFVSRAGTPLRLDNLGGPLRKLCEMADVPIITSHMLRRTYTSAKGAQGENIERLAKQLGHSSTSTTLEHYRQVYDSEMEGMTYDPTEGADVDSGMRN